MPIHAQLLKQQDLKERRTSARRTLQLQIPGSTSAQVTSVLIHDLSQTGLLMECPGDLSVGDTFHVDLPQIGKAEGEVVWNSGAFFGCKFREPIARAGVSAALLRSPAPATEITDSSARDDTYLDNGADEGVRFIRGVLIALPISAALWALLIFLVS